MNTVKWSAIGIGTKNQEGNWLEMLYQPSEGIPTNFNQDKILVE